MSESTDELQHMILQLHIDGQKVGLKMIMKKIKVMFTNFIQNKIKLYDEVS